MVDFVRSRGPDYFIFLHVAQWESVALHTIHFLIPSFPRCPFLSGKEDHKDDEEDHQYKEYLNHEPAVGGDGLKVLEDLGVGHFHVQLSVLHIGINPTERHGKLASSRV